MPTIAHVAIWTDNLETLKTFYCHYFEGVAGEKYANPSKQFESYFITFQSGARLELMRLQNLSPAANSSPPLCGYAHIAMSVGSAQAVNALTARLAADGYKVVSQPRTTGDGYYESVVHDPDGNAVEITI